MSNATYYEYQDVKVNIAHRLFEMEGWKVYGYHASESDPYTDYYDPAYWSGIAEKNGYILVVDRSDCQKEQNETRTRRTAEIPADLREKIAKLEQMTQERGASAAEEQTAREKIEALKAKESEGVETYTVHTPGHLANPPRCNWHIEKDGIIFEKGTGLLKFADVPDITKDREREAWQKFNNQTPEEWKADFVRSEVMRWNEAEERAREIAESRYKSTCEKYALLEQFNKLLAKFNNTAGGMVGDNGEDGYIFEEVTKTEYKEELKPVKDPAGSIKDGQLFRTVKSFNYGIFSGYVYRIHETESTDRNGETVKLYHAYRLGKGYKKERTGNATASNYWYIGTADSERFLKWIESGSLEWVNLETVRTPYEVKKVVKKYTGNHETVKKTAETTTSTTESTTAGGYIITPDTDTRDGSPLWVVTLSARVDRAQFEAIREQMKNVGGYYSRFKKGFIFREDPTAKLNGAPAQDVTESASDQAPAQEEPTQEPETATESTQTEESTTTPEKGEEKPKTNRIPRNATRLHIRYNIGTNAGEAGIRATVERDESGQYIATMETGERFTVFLEHLRNPEIVTIDRIETTEDKAPAETPAENTTAEPTRETPEKQATKESEEKTEESAPGYTGPGSDLFTPKELEALEKGKQVPKGDDYRGAVYISTPAEGFRTVYRIHTGESHKITTRTNAEYVGIIHAGKYYNTLSDIREALTLEIDNALKCAIPTEESARHNAGNLDEREAESIKYYATRDTTKDAQRHIIEGTAPTLKLYGNGDRLSDSDCIRYLIEPANIVSDIVSAYRKTHRVEILKAYTDHNRTARRYAEMKRDPGDVVHVLSAIYHAIGEELKTVKITLKNGATVKADANGVRRIAYAGSISPYYIANPDRQHLQKDERGRDLDIMPEEIQRITHGARTLYEAPQNLRRSA